MQKVCCLGLAIVLMVLVLSALPAVAQETG
jgi:hypothetical protein